MAKLVCVLLLVFVAQSYAQSPANPAVLIQTALSNILNGGLLKTINQVAAAINPMIEFGTEMSKAVNAGNLNDILMEIYEAVNHLVMSLISIRNETPVRNCTKNESNRMLKSWNITISTTENCFKNVAPRLENVTVEVNQTVNSTLKLVTAIAQDVTQCVQVSDLITCFGNLTRKYETQVEALIVNIFAKIQKTQALVQSEIQQNMFCMIPVMPQVSNIIRVCRVQ